MKKILIFSLILLFGFSLARAELTLYTDRDEFIKDVSSLGFHVINFEAFDPGDLNPGIPGRAIIADQEFIVTHPVDPTDPVAPFTIDASFSAPSGRNYLGLNGDKAFLSGDELEIQFSQAVHAVGLYVVAETNVIWEADFTLAVGSDEIMNPESPQDVLEDASEVFFMGILETDPAKKFSTATLSSNGWSAAYDNVGYEFHIDDVIYGTTASLNPDFNADCDVDGHDLFVLLASPFTPKSLAEFAGEFGRIGPCPVIPDE